MTPSEYIASIKADEPTATVEESSLPDRVKTQWVESGQDITDLLGSINQSDWAEHLLDHIKPRAHPALVSLLDSDFIAIGTIGNPSPNAYVKKLDTGYAIVFHAGLRDFIYRIARIIATRFRPSDTEDEPTGDDIQETARLIAEVFWWFQETGRAFGPQYQIDENRTHIANLLAIEAEAFLIAHEIGHIIVDGIDSASQHLLDFPDELSPSHRDEFTADLLGLQLVLELHNEKAKRDACRTPFQYAGVEFALQIYRGLEELGFDFHDSHPAAGSRIGIIRSEMQRRCADDSSWDSLFGLAGAIDSMFTQLIHIITEPGEHTEFFERAANSIVLDLNQALDRCTGGMIPNYTEFYRLAAEIFGRGYSHIMLQRVAQVAADFFADVRSTDNGNLKPDHASWVRFQKFKLLYGYIHQYLNEPARRIFIEAFESHQHKC